MTEGTIVTDRERLPVMLAYGLYLLAVTNGVTMLIGFIVALARQGSARGTIYEGHYRNLIRVFLTIMAATGLMLALAAALMWDGVLAWFSQGAAFDFSWGFPLAMLLVPAAAMGWFVLGLWYLWRVIGGFIRALEEQPY